MGEGLWLAVRDSAGLYFLGWVGWRVFERLQVPAASLLGAIAAVGAAQALGLRLEHVPWALKLVLQIILGTFIGLRFKKDTPASLRRLAGPAFLVSSWMLASCFLVGLVFLKLTEVTPVTAVLGAAPGGVAEMSMLALSLDADALVVAVLQIMRLLGILMVIPFLAARRATGQLPDGEAEPAAVGPAWGCPALATLLTGAVGGGIGQYLNWPAAGLLGALLAVGLTSSFYRELSPLPQDLRVWAQVGIGGLVGLSFTPEALAQTWGMAGPVLTSTAALIGSGLVLAAVLRRLTGWDSLTCLLAAAPGGVTQFFILACELGADPLKVSLLQLARLLSILGILPLLLRLPLW
ncbi:MAG TPA: AbrB family transcriptional regulator [Firmicutes bacterium]|nr:AbrB family transcriptional regulator [Bacillota bacterium]